MREVGDGSEYRVMADRLLAGERLPPFRHFWLYSALAAPFVFVARGLGFETLTGFVPLNLALMLAAFWIASRVLTWPALLLLFASPIVWWIDKAHTEVLTFALLMVALLWLPERPWWSVLSLGIAGAQNPPILPLVPIATALVLIFEPATRRDWRLFGAAGLALAIGALNPGYYLWRVGEALPLSAAAHGQIPNLQELVAVIRDLNIGLVPNAPIFALAAGLVAGLVLVRRPRSLLAPDVAVTLCALAIFLVSFAQTKNVNHGGTPGASRYVLWLIPLAAPFLRRVPDVAASMRTHRALASMALVSGLWAIVMFHPAHPQEYGRPSWLAGWIWTRYPWLDSPPPEVFIERLYGADADWWLPAITPQCEKILLTGRGDDNPVWPLPCAPQEVPSACKVAGQLCYANRHADRYTFSTIPAPSYWGYRFAPAAVWTHAEAPTIGRLLGEMRWWEMEIVTGSSEAALRAAYEVDRAFEYRGSDRLLLYLRNVRDGATLTLRLPSRMEGEVLDVEAGGTMLQTVLYDGEPGEAWELPLPAPHAALAITLKRRP